MQRNLITEAQNECEEHGPKNHASTAPEWRAPVPFERGIRALYPWSNSPRPDAPPRYPGRTAMLKRLFNQPRDTIKQWRTGRRAPPEWAIDALTTQLEQNAVEYAAAARLLRESKKPAQTRTGLKER